MNNPAKMKITESSSGRNLFAYLREVTSSFRLFSVDKSGLQIIKYFSHRHKLHRLEAGLYVVACFNIFHDILKSVLVSFNCQMCLLSSVLSLLLGLVKEALWFVNLVLKEFSVRPMYVWSGLLSSVITVA